MLLNLKRLTFVILKHTSLVGLVSEPKTREREQKTCLTQKEIRDVVARHIISTIDRMRDESGATQIIPCL